MTRPTATNRHALAALVLSCLMLAGMLLGTWPLVLYPALLLVGVLLSASLAGDGRPRAAAVPLGITGLLVALFALLHAGGLEEPAGTSTVWGWDPLTALYLFVVGPAFLLVGVVYGLTAGADVTEAEEAHA